LGESRTPVTISFVTVLANAGLNFALVHAMGYRGLALGTSIAALLNAALLLVMLRKRLGGIEGGAIAGALARIAVAAALMGAAAAGANAFLAARIPGDGLAAQLARVGITIGVALAVLGGAAHLLRVPQFAEAVSMITRRLRRLRR
jgi:putative peptidoglycan lipid II flippase